MKVVSAAVLSMMGALAYSNTVPALPGACPA